MRPHGPLRAVLFDFDGTILDTETPEFEEWRAAFRARGHELGLHEDCVVFEDSPNGIAAARAAGMRCVAIPNPPTRHLALGQADLVVESLDGLPLAEILARLRPSDPPSV